MLVLSLGFFAKKLSEKFKGMIELAPLNLSVTLLNSLAEISVWKQNIEMSEFAVQL